MARRAARLYQHFSALTGAAPEAQRRPQRHLPATAVPRHKRLVERNSAKVATLGCLCRAIGPKPARPFSRHSYIQSLAENSSPRGASIERVRHRSGLTVVVPREFPRRTLLLLSQHVFDELA